jgi:DtxR family Mn-dependent transcriptional regulator
MFEKETWLSDSLEDYLEIILSLEKQNKVARVKDIAEEMGVLRGSVTSAMKKLGENDLINYEPYSFITLTPKGAAIAREVTRRHEVIKDFLINVLQIDPEKAETNACRMEHVMDKTSIDRLVQFIKYIHHNTEIRTDWIRFVANNKPQNKRYKEK